MKLERAILADLKPHCSKRRAEHDVGYVGSKLVMMGCTVPTMRKVFRDVVCLLENDLSHSEIRKELNHLLKETNSHDVVSFCLFYFSDRIGKNTLADWRTLKSWSRKIDNWAHSDYLSSIYSDLLERFPKHVYPTLKAWNTHKNSWFRRLSLTSLIYYSNARSAFLPQKKIFPLIKARLTDPDPYVQKAVGWQLRECGNIWPKETKNFIDKHLTELSSTAFSYATEKWSQKEKEPRKRRRKESRRKK